MKTFSSQYRLLLIFTLLLGSTEFMSAAETPDCTSADYKIVANNLMAVQCKEEVPGHTGKGKLFLSDNPVAVGSADISSYPNAAQWLIVALSPVNPGNGLLASGKKYRLVFTLSPSHIVPAPQTSLDVSVDSTIQVSPVDSIGANSRFEFVSHLGYSQGPGKFCTLQTENFDRRVRSLSAGCKLNAPLPSTVTAESLPRSAPSPEDIGSLFLTLDNDKNVQEIPFSVPGLLDVFGDAIKIDTKGQIAPGKAPPNKDSADYYLNFNHSAAAGSKPAWTLNGKIAPPLGGLHGGFQFAPLAAADVGQNQIAGIKFADTIDFGATVSRIFEFSGWLQGLLLSPGVTYETDKEFDRHNLMATPDFKYYFKHLYNPQRRRTLKKFADELKIAACTDEPQPCTPIPWSIENSKPALWGFSFDVHTGAELGGALRDTTVKASTGNATQLLPSYTIARFVPVVHTLIEIQRFSIDESLTGRYLGTSENTVFEAKDHTLHLETVQGWRAYSVLTGAYNLDPSGRFAATISYKNGFSPPQFQRINVVQSGITFKY